MASGNTTTDALNDSLPSIVSSARKIREQKGAMVQSVDRVTLKKGTGLSWKEVELAKLTAQDITESTVLSNYQQLADTPFTIKPTVSGIVTLILDRVALRISKNAFAQTGGLAQTAIQRKKDVDGLAIFSTATNTFAGAGTTLTSGHISAASEEITSNTTEPGEAPLIAVLHGRQIHDIFTEITAPVGTGEITSGVTANALRLGFQGKILNVDIIEDGNISIDGLDDARGAVFAMRGIVLVQGFMPRAETMRRPDIGGGATAVFLYDEYAYGERSPGNWMYGIFSDASQVTA